MWVSHILLFALLLLSQRQSAADKQNTQGQIEKPAVNQSVSDKRSPSPDKTEISASDHNNSSREQRVKEINDALLVVFTFFLVVVGFLQWAVLRKHEGWMKRNTEIANKAADSALLNAQSVIRSERAYMVVQIRSNATGIYEFTAINHGRTPAEITSISGSFVQLDSEADLPEQASYQDKELIDAQVVSSGKNVEIGEWAFGREVQVVADKVTIFYGRVCYRDIIGERHESRYCFKFDRTQYTLVRCGPKGYNEYT